MSLGQDWHVTTSLTQPFPQLPSDSRSDTPSDLDASLSAPLRPSPDLRQRPSARATASTQNTCPGRPDSPAEGAHCARSAARRRSVDAAPGAVEWGQKPAPLVRFLCSIRSRGGHLPRALASGPNGCSPGHLSGHGDAGIHNFLPVFWANGGPFAAPTLQRGAVAFCTSGASPVLSFGNQRPAQRPAEWAGFLLGHCRFCKHAGGPTMGHPQRPIHRAPPRPTVQ